MSDLIDREDLIDWLTSRIIMLKGIYDDLGEMVKVMPSAEPEQKKGKWMMNSDYPDHLICSECNGRFDVWHWESKQMHFCPNCGADMRGL